MSILDWIRHPSGATVTVAGPTPTPTPEISTSTIPEVPEQPVVVAVQETKVSVLTTVEKDINIAETWITSAATKVETLFSKAIALEPTVAADIAALVTKTETFLATATPAIAGEGLNFPADSVAYAAFTAMVAQWQATASTILTAVKSL